jgi:hypothetical protein
VKPLNPGQRHMFDRQTDGRFAVKAHGRPPSVPVTASPICGTPTLDAPVSLPQDHLVFLLVQIRLMHREEFCILAKEIPMHNAFCFKANLEKRKNVDRIIFSNSVYIYILNSLNFRSYIGVNFQDTVRFTRYVER